MASKVGAFGQVFKRLIHWHKKELSDIKDTTMRKHVDDYVKSIEEEFPKVKKVELRGTELHTSHDDKAETQKVISMRFLDSKNSRLGSAHVREDGTGTTKWKKNAK